MARTFKHLPYDDTNDLIPSRLRTCTIHSATDEFYWPPTIGLVIQMAAYNGHVLQSVLDKRFPVVLWKVVADLVCYLCGWL